MTPTREQECKHEHIKTWVFADTKEPAMWSCAECGVKFAPEMATLTAGRDQGLREAKEVCEAMSARVVKANTSRGRTNSAAVFSSGLLDDCASAIEQLRGE